MAGGIRRLSGLLVGAVLSMSGSATLAEAQRPDFALDTLRATVGARAWDGLPAALRSVELIERAQIAASPAGSVSDLLSWMLGVDLQPRSPAQADVAIRGASFEQVLVLVDGQRVSDAQTGHFDLDLTVPLDEVERIEVLRGPASAQYGSDAMGGVIHIVTRGGTSGHARVEGGTHSTAAVSVSGGAAVGESTGRLGAEVRRSDGTRSGTDYDIGVARGGIEVPVAGGRLRADAGFAARDFGAADFYAPYDSYEETRTYTASVGWAPRSAQRFAVEPRLTARRHDDDFILVRDDPALYRNQHTNWLLGGEVVTRYLASPSARIVLGAEAYRDLLESNSLGDREQTRTAAFGELAAGRVGSALGQLGLRADWNSDYGGFFAPSIAGAIWPHERLRLRASAGRSFRAPGWTERFYQDPGNIGNPDLLPERAWSAELGAALALSALRIDVAGYIRRADAVIDWAKPEGAAESDPFHTMNIETATYSGVEATIAWYDPLGTRWSIAGEAISVDAEDAAGFTSKYALRPVAHAVTLGADRELGRGFIAALRTRHARHVGEDAHLLADIRVTYALDRLRAFVDVTNLTDADYLDVSVQPAPGRAARLGLEWKIGG